MNSDKNDIEPALSAASFLDTLRILFGVMLPTVSIGIIMRRPKLMAIAERRQWDRRAVRVLERMRTRYGSGPLKLRIPGRSIVVLLSHYQVGELLRNAPDPFSPSSYEKRAALRHFQPHGVLISQGPSREERRQINEFALDTPSSLHELADPWNNVIQTQTQLLIQSVAENHSIDGNDLLCSWRSIVHHIVWGTDQAKEKRITQLMLRLRKDANWAYLHPRRNKVRSELREMIEEEMQDPPENSLAAKLSRARGRPDSDPAGQIPHWLFAFDAAAAVAARALALLATHPQQRDHVITEVESADLTKPQQFPYLRACVLESVRLWPTTPALLRESTAQTEWGRVKTSFLVFTPFFHRDVEKLSYAHRFTPEIWLDGTAHTQPALVPFSAGPAVCPGQNLVLFSTSTFLAHMSKYRWRLTSPALLSQKNSLPLTVNNFGLRFALDTKTKVVD